MNPVKIKDLFAGRIDRRIEEVIKVDQTNAQIVVEEIEEYVATDSIRRACARILERYYETRNKPHEGVGIWISGFFGSGKSSFAKNVGLALENRDLLGTGAAERFGQRTADDRIRVLLKNITERIPTATVVFDLSTDRGIRSGNQMLTEIMYRELLERLGYARDPDLAELEITLEDDGRLDTFKSTYERLFRKDWDTEKGKVAFALSEASRVMHELDRDTYTAADSWVRAAKSRAELSANILAERAMQLLDRRYPDHALAFVIDEAGQFVARDVQKMLDLQGIVQALGRAGRGKLWIMVTSQERLSDVVGGIDDKRVELARLMDRFPQELQVHLEPSDISEVTSKRVLSKNAEAERVLRELFEQNRGRLTANTRLTADIKLPELTAESFITLYPLLPYQVDLIIQIVSGLRMQGGASKHVGGANRTIIKLAQQLLINPAVALAEEPIGKLATVENVYDLVRGNIESEIRDKIDRIPAEVDHPLAQLLELALEGRRRVKEQLKKMGSFEFYHTSFSYQRSATGEECFVGVPEQGGRDLISTDPLAPGAVYTASVSSDGTVGLYRLEVAVSAGNGKLKMAGRASGVMKESIQRAFSYLWAWPSLSPRSPLCARPQRVRPP